MLAFVLSPGARVTSSKTVVFVAVVRVSYEVQAGVTQYSLWLSQGQAVLLLTQLQLSSAMIPIL